MPEKQSKKMVTFQEAYDKIILMIVPGRND